MTPLQREWIAIAIFAFTYLLISGREVGFWDYAKFGIPVTCLTLVAGMATLLAMG